MSRSDYLVRLRPRDDTRYVSRGRTVLATGRDGFVSGGAEHGLFAYQTRLLSRYRYLVDGEEPRPVALSNVEQHSWLGYYITLAPGVDPGPPDQGSGLMQAETEQSLELRVSRYVGEGVHEDLDLTNYTREAVSFLFEVEADFAASSWQAALASPDLMRGTLPEIAEYQGRDVNDWRDEQPGKMIHEAHAGPLAALGYTPRGRYYGSITTSGFFPVILSELWHWTGDEGLVRSLVPAALGALRWLDEYSDRDGDGFYEYLTRSAQGVKHQAWKDSPDALVYEDGTTVEPPVATCEEQGFAYLAKLHMSEVLWWLGEKAEAKRLFGEAGELKKRFNEKFWMEREGFFALGLDGDKRQIRSINSNPGHCLATAIVDESLVGRTAERLMREDLFSGWGVRTLSSENPAYNPYSYHRGSVWPVENGTFALAFMRYGLHERVEQVARAQFEAAALFDFYRLPELFSGHRRDRAHPFPALYPQANSPQAWSASAVFTLLQSLLGLYPYAPLRMLLVDPHLPEWLPEITLRGLRVGDAKVSVRFYRDASGESGYEVLEKEGALHLLRQPSPWSLTAGWAERLKDVLTSLLPGR